MGDVTKTQTPWQRDRDEWVKTLTVDEGKHLSNLITRGRVRDDNEGDSTERRGALKWLHTRGREGEEWGIVATYARRLGLYPRP